MAALQVMKKKEEEGGLYEVAFDSVWIRREPDSGAARVSKRIKGQRVRILELPRMTRSITF